MPVRRAITIGHFDGVHLGHAALVRAAREAVGSSGRVTVLAFDPHPLAVLRPEAAPTRISTIEQRRAWLTRLGADEVVTLMPDRALLGQSPEAYLDTLRETHHPDFIVEGGDFRFGRGRSGSAETLREQGPPRGFEAVIVEPVETALTDQSIVEVRSSLVRWLLERGRVADAACCLGRAYEITGTVVRGDRRGRELGVPTANLDHGGVMLPADGIYAGHGVGPDGRMVPAAISVGTKPTFGTSPRVCEAHLIDWTAPADEYGWTLRVYIRHWIREQVAYAGPERLIEQLHRDIDRVRHAPGLVSEPA